MVIVIFNKKAFKKRGLFLKDMPKAKKTKKTAKKKEKKEAMKTPKEAVKTPAVSAVTLESTLTESKTESKSEKKKVITYMHDERVLTESCDEARDLYSQSRYGTMVDDGKVQLSLLEGLYLKEKGKIIILDGRGKDINAESFLKRAKRQEANFWTKYCVFKDFRNRGYIIKTALKFGASSGWDWSRCRCTIG